MWNLVGVLTTLSLVICTGKADIFGGSFNGSSDDFFHNFNFNNGNGNNGGDPWNSGQDVPAIDPSVNGNDLWNSGQDVPAINPPINGDDLWNSGQDVPAINPPITGGDLWNTGQEVPVVHSSGSEGGNTTGNFSVSGNVFCHPNYCQVFNPCNRSSKCVNSKECNVTTCEVTVVKTTPRTNDNTNNLPENNCADVSGIYCPDPSYCIGLETCACKPGFSGFKCLKQCNLSCVSGHGVCSFGKELNSEDKESQFCNCLPEWEGQFCEIEKVDPKVAASKAREKEENARVMAGVLAAAAAVAICVAIATPIILWRLRVIFVLKLIYFFKPYEDDESKIYDAYVSMTPTSNAEKFVYTELSPKLENLGFKLYIQSRDSLPGEVLSEGILEAVEKSRCTIMIITQDYIRNEWNRFEYLIAQEESLKLRQKIIPIILEKLDKDSTLDKALKHILDSVKCIRYPHQKSSQPAEDSIQSPSDQSPSVQSPSLIKLLNNNIFKKSSDRNNSDTCSDKKQARLFKTEEKFWKCLELTMPKIKRLKNRDGIDSKKHEHVKNNFYQQQSLNSYSLKTMEILDAKFTDTQLHEIVLE